MPRSRQSVLTGTEKIVAHLTVNLQGAEGITEKGHSPRLPVDEQHWQTVAFESRQTIGRLPTGEFLLDHLIRHCRIWITTSGKKFHGVVEGVVQVMERFVGALSLTLLLTGLSAVVQVQPSKDPATQAVRAGLMTPTPDQNFRSDVVLSRAELASILVKTFHLNERISDSTKALPLQDVPPTHWAYQDIQTVLRDGIMEGYRAGRFYPDQRVTRAEAFSIFAQAYGVYQFPDRTVDTILADYPDADAIPDWAKKPMATALYEGFVDIRDGNRIDPLSPMTRGDMVYALNIHLRRQQTPAEVPWQQIPLRG